MRSDELAQAKEWCARHGWQPFFTEAKHTAAGRPTARSHVAAAVLEGTPFGEGCEAAPGYAVPLHVDCATRGGPIAGSVYLNDTGRWSQVNAFRLHKVAETLVSSSKPHSGGGDWNVAPEVLLTDAQRAAGALLHSTAGTCRSPIAPRQSSWMGGQRM